MWKENLILKYEMLNIIILQTSQINFIFFMIFGMELQNKRNLILIGHSKTQGQKVQPDDNYAKPKLIWWSIRVQIPRWLYWEGMDRKASSLNWYNINFIYFFFKILYLCLVCLLKKYFISNFGCDLDFDFGQTFCMILD